MYMPTADSDDDGRFMIDELQAGTYSIFGENDAAGYPNTALPFYPNQNPLRVTLGDFGTASVVLVLGPKAGVLCGTLLDGTTGKVIKSPHGVHFIVRKVSNPEDSIEFAGPPPFHWLIPPGTEVTLDVLAEGYKHWTYADLSSPLRSIPLRLEPGEEKILNIRLERDSRAENKSP